MSSTCKNIPLQVRKCCQLARGSAYFATEIGVTQDTVMAWVRGDVTPSTANQKLIEQYLRKQFKRRTEPKKRAALDFWSIILMGAFFAWAMGVRR